MAMLKNQMVIIIFHHRFSADYVIFIMISMRTQWPERGPFKHHMAILLPMV